MPAGEWLKLAPFRILSVDIECAGRKVRSAVRHPHAVMDCCVSFWQGLQLASTHEQWTVQGMTPPLKGCSISVEIVCAYAPEWYTRTSRSSS